MQRPLIPHALALVLACLAGAALAADYKLKNGTTLSGDSISWTDKGVVIKTPDNRALPRESWTNFSQEGLKELAKHPKARPFVELLIEEAAAPAGGAGELNLPETTAPKREWKQPRAVADRPEQPEQPGIIAGLVSTGVGWFCLLAMYGAVIYAGYEVALYRRRPRPLVMGLSAIPGLGFFAPVVFLCLPAVKTEEEAKPNAVAQAAAQQAKAEEKAEAKPGAAKKKPGLAFGKKAEEGGHAAAPAGPRPVATAKPGAAVASAVPSPVKAPAPPGSASLEPAVYRRGETNINKRFVETKFAGFFKAIPGPAEREMWLVWVTATGGEYWSKRVVSISQTEVVVNCPQEGGGSLDQTVQLVEIQEIHLRPQEG